MTDKLTPEQVAENMALDIGLAQAAVERLNAMADMSCMAEASGVAAILADRASLVAELKSREQEAMDFAKYVIDDFQRTGSVGPLAVLYAAFHTSGN